MTLSFGGGTASNTGAEDDLAADAGGDVLGVDAGGDALLVDSTLALIFTGVNAFNGGTESDLSTDAGGDLLTVDAAGDTLLAMAGFVWLGGTAATVVADRTEGVEAEAWVGIVTETGSRISTEGS
jgi:hypothetical protein